MSVVIRTDALPMTDAEQQKLFADAAAKSTSKQSTLPLGFIEATELDKARGRKALEAIGPARQTTPPGFYEALDRNSERGRTAIEQVDAARSSTGFDADK